MNHRVLIAVLIIIIIILAGGVLVLLPKESKAPTAAVDVPHDTSETTSTDPIPAPAASSSSQATLPDLITVDAPLPGETIASPLTISGKARGSWFFEASAPIELKDASGVVVGHGTMKAVGNWQTQDYVPFTATLTFTAPSTPTGTLILKNDNPSGDPARQKELDIPVKF